MSRSSRLLFAAGAVFLPVVLAPLLFVQPVLAIGFVVAVGVTAAASRSIVYPVALAGLPAVAIGLSGGANPFPPGTIATFGFAWTAFAIALAVMRNDQELPLRILLTPVVVSTLLLTMWLLVRLGPSPDPTYGSSKLQLFVSVNVTLLIAGILIGSRRDRFDLYVLVRLVMAILSSLALIRGLLSGQTGSVGGRFSVTANDSPIGLGRDSARGLLFAVFILLVSRVPWMRVLAFASMPLVAVALLAAGSRGPLVGLVVALAVLLLLSVQEPSARRRVLLVISGLALAVIFVPQLVPGQNIGRALSIFSGTSEGVSTNGRSELWSHAWELFNAHPLVGVGTGGFGFFEPVELYPHNILLEVGAELGIVGVVLVLGTVIASSVQLRRAWAGSSGDDRAQAGLVIALLAADLTNASLSSDVTTNGALWLAAGLAVGLGRRLDVPLLSLGPLAMMRGRRRVAAVGGHRGAPSAGRTAVVAKVPVGSRGRIVTPVDGETVAGIVRVEVVPARLPRPTERVRLEWSEGGGEWAQVEELDDRAYEVLVDARPAAVVRSEWLAQLIASSLGARVRRARRTPWPAGASSVFAWDASLVTEGASGSLRAITRDLSGTEVATDEVRVAIGEAFPGQKRRPAIQPAAVVARIRCGADEGIAERAPEICSQVEDLDRRALELEAENVRLRALEASLQEVRAELERQRADQQAAEDARAAAAALLDEHVEALTSLDERAVALDARGAEVARAIAAAQSLEEAARAIAGRLGAVMRRARELDERSSQLAEADSALASREASLEEREQAFVDEREWLDARRAELDAGDLRLRGQEGGAGAGA